MNMFFFLLNSKVFFARAFRFVSVVVVVVCVVDIILLTTSRQSKCVRCAAAASIDSTQYWLRTHLSPL